MKKKLSIGINLISLCILIYTFVGISFNINLLPHYSNIVKNEKIEKINNLDNAIELKKNYINELNIQHAFSAERNKESKTNCILILFCIILLIINTFFLYKKD